MKERTRNGHLSLNANLVLLSSSLHVLGNRLLTESLRLSVVRSLPPNALGVLVHMVLWIFDFLAYLVKIHLDLLNGPWLRLAKFREKPL